MAKPRKSMMKRPVPEGESSDTSMESKPQKMSLNSLMISRLEEKQELQHLNDRLANYIEYLHKSIFGKELRSHVDLLTESLKDKLDDYTKGFANEVELLRQNLNRTAWDLANSKSQLKKATSELEETLKQLKHSKSKENELTNKVISLTNQLSQLQSQLADCIHCKTDYDSLLEQHKILKSHLENETLLHTDTKNRLITALEQLEFKDQLLDKERNIWNSESIQLHLTSVIKGAEANYNDRLQELLYELRSQMEAQYDDAKRKIEEGLKANLDAEKLRTSTLEKDLINKLNECQRLSLLVSSHTTELSGCRNELEAARKEIENLERKLRVSEDKLNGVASHHRSEIERLLGLLADKSTECAELAGIKIQLDAEIAMYRKLLESEESRLHLSPDAKMTGTPIIRTSISSTTKRSRDKRSSSVLVDQQQQPPVKRPHDVDLDVTVDLSKSDITPGRHQPFASTPLFRVPYPPHTATASADHDDDLSTTQETLHSKHTSQLKTKTVIWPTDSKLFKLHKSGLSTSSSSLIGNSVRITCHSDGPIHFASADPGDGLLRIYNASEKVINLSNWRLYAGPTRDGSSDFAQLYTFPDCQILKPHAELQVFLCWAAEPSQVSSSKRPCRDVAATLHLITPISIWNQYNSLIALQDSFGSVRATCEMQPCGEKFSKTTTAVSHSVKDNDSSASSVDGSDNESSSSDYHDTLTVQPEHQSESVKRVTISETKEILSSARSISSGSSSGSRSAHFDLPQRVSMVHFRNNIWSNESHSATNRRNSFTCEIL
ncbi:unnamed protein product [Trichobilharzia szidati]|nr:unnamed protein product [Trichobilharzia szidati]CAH8857438.1 unnamed protein product [Trichobilharzia szidati]